MTTKTMSQDDTNTHNEGTDDNKINDGDQGTKTNDEELDEEDNHHTGTETETDNHNHKIKTAVAAGARRDDEHGTRTDGAGDGYSAVRRAFKGSKRHRRRLLGRR